MIDGIWFLALVVLGALWVAHMIRTAPMEPGEYSRLDNMDGRREDASDDEAREVA
jgi:hypothetical protein